MATTIKPLLASPRSLPTTTSSPTGTRKRIVDDGSLKTMIVIAIASVFCILLALIFVVSLAVSSSNAVGEETAAANAADQQHLSGPKTNATDRRNHHPMGEYLSGRLRSAVSAERRQLDRALRRIRHLGESNLPARLRNLRERHAVVGERLVEVRDGVKTVSEILHGHDRSLLAGSSAAARPPMELDEIIEFLDSWIHLLHETLLQHKHSDHVQVWQAYHDLTVATLYPWDQEYLRRMPKRRDDGSIFLSLASYRDENCPNTIHEAYRKAKNPEKLFVGLVQQNCHHNCRSGVMSNQSVYDVPPDESCLDLFCKTDLGASICGNKQVRLLDIDEPESLGPYAARFFASKLWYGENWFMQTDSHMTFAGNWDATSIEMLTAAPSEKPILSHYPPAHTVDLDGAANINAPGARVCGPVFTTGQAEAQMVRLEGAGADHQKLKTPAFAPFTAAGYFVALADFLHEVPFDPFLPWSKCSTSGIKSVRSNDSRPLTKPLFLELFFSYCSFHGRRNYHEYSLLDRRIRYFLTHHIGGRTHVRKTRKTQVLGISKSRVHIRGKCYLRCV